jgi:MFS family permease
MFVVAWRLMRDLGFTPRPARHPWREMTRLLRESVDNGWRRPAVKWLMLEAFFTGGVGFYVFYALQPYLLELYGDPKAYQIAGLVAAIVAGAQILGGLAAPWIRRLFRRRTSALIATTIGSAAALVAIGGLTSFLAAIAVIVVWALLYAAELPIRQSYINGLIPSQQRATILSFDSLVGSAGGVWSQPLLGRSADVWGYGGSFVLSGGITVLALPFLALSRRQRAPADVRVSPVSAEPPAQPPETGADRPPAGAAT